MNNKSHEKNETRVTCVFADNITRNRCQLNNETLDLVEKSLEMLWAALLATWEILGRIMQSSAKTGGGWKWRKRRHLHTKGKVVNSIRSPRGHQILRVDCKKTIFHRTVPETASWKCGYLLSSSSTKFHLGKYIQQTIMKNGVQRLFRKLWVLHPCDEKSGSFRVGLWRIWII